MFILIVLNLMEHKSKPEHLPVTNKDQVLFFRKL